jgi:hypothetical protein
MSSHQKGPQIHGDFCGTHLRFVMSCSDTTIEGALSQLPDYDLGRLRRILGAMKVQSTPEADRKKAG